MRNSNAHYFGEGQSSRAHEFVPAPASSDGAPAEDGRTKHADERWQEYCGISTGTFVSGEDAHAISYSFGVLVGEEWGRREALAGLAPLVEAARAVLADVDSTVALYSTRTHPTSVFEQLRAALAQVDRPGGTCDG